MLQCVRTVIILAMVMIGGSSTRLHSAIASSAPFGDVNKDGAAARHIHGATTGFPPPDHVLGNEPEPALRRHSVSGFSAGASVAINHLVAFSGVVDGVGVIGASPCVTFFDFLSEYSFLYLYIFNMSLSLTVFYFTFQIQSQTSRSHLHVRALTLPQYMRIASHRLGMGAPCCQMLVTRARDSRHPDIAKTRPYRGGCVFIVGLNEKDILSTSVLVG